MATTLASIRKQIADLEKKAEALIKEEAQGAIAKVRELIDRYGLSAEDLGFGGGAKAGRRTGATPGRKKKATAKSAGVPLYRDPETGKTWTGRGKPPAWIAGAKSRDAFLISPEAAGPASGEAPTKPLRRSGRKAAVKTAAKVATPAKPRRTAKASAKPAAKPVAKRGASKAVKPTRAKRLAKAAPAPADQANPSASGDAGVSTS